MFFTCLSQSMGVRLTGMSLLPPHWLASGILGIIYQ